VPRIAAAATFVLSINAAALCAQDSANWSTSSRPAEPDISSPTLGGIGMGLAGFALGAYVGTRAGHNSGDCGDDGCITQGLYGAAIGGTFGLALGIHLGNRRRGNFLVDFAAAGGIWGAGMELGTLLHWRGQAPLVILTGIPIAQLMVTTSVERATGRKRDRAETAAIEFIPQARGAAVAVTLPLPIIH
jgi:hypothetical protein